MPPLSEGNIPLLGLDAKAMLHKYIATGHNTVLPQPWTLDPEP